MAKNENKLPKIPEASKHGIYAVLSPLFNMRYQKFKLFTRHTTRTIELKNLGKELGRHQEYRVKYMLLMIDMGEKIQRAYTNLRDYRRVDFSEIKEFCDFHSHPLFIAEGKNSSSQGLQNLYKGKIKNITDESYLLWVRILQDYLIELTTVLKAMKISMTINKIPTYAEHSKTPNQE